MNLKLHIKWACSTLPLNIWLYLFFKVKSKAGLIDSLDAYNRNSALFFI